MADTFQVRKYRYACFRLHALDQALAAARYDDVDRAVETAEHHADGDAVARRHQLDGGFRQAGLAETECDRRVDGTAGMGRVRAAA